MVGSSTVGFVLSFMDQASGPIKDVTDAYSAMTKAMEFARKKAQDTLAFTNGLSRITEALQEVIRYGNQAQDTLSTLSAGVYSSPEMSIQAAMMESGERGLFLDSPENLALGRRDDLMGDILGDGLDSKGFDAASKTFKEYGKVQKNWILSFGSKVKDFWDKWAKNMEKGRNSFHKMAQDIKETKIMTALNTLHSGMEHLGRFGDIGGAGEAVESFMASTARLTKIKGLDRTKMKEQRMLLRDTFKDAAIDVSEASAAYLTLVESGMDLGKSTAVLAKNIQTLSELTGVDLTDSVELLTRHFEMSNGAVTDFYASIRQAAADPKFKTSFNEIQETIAGIIPSLSILHSQLSDTQKVSVTKGFASIAAGLRSAGVSAETSSNVIQMLTDSLTDPDLAINLMKLGIDPLKALKSQKPEQIIDILGRISEGMKAGSLFSGKLAEKYSEKFGVATDVMFELQGRTDLASKSIEQFYSQSTTATGVVENMTSTLKGQRSVFDDLIKRFKNFVSTQPAIGGVADSLEKLSPLLMATYASVSLLKETPGIFFDIAKALLFTTPKLIAQGIATASATVAQWGLNVAMFANPVGLIVLGVIALIGIIILLVKYWKPITKAIKDTWNWITKLVKGIVKAVVGFKHWKDVLLILIGPIGWIIQGVRLLQKFLKTHPKAGFFDWMLAGIEAVMSALGWVWDKIKGLWNMIFAKKVTNANQNIIDPVQASAKTVEPIIKKDQASITTTPDGQSSDVNVKQEDVVDALDKILSVLQDMRDGKKGGFGGSKRSGISPDRLAIAGEM